MRKAHGHLRAAHALQTPDTGQEIPPAEDTHFFSFTPPFLPARCQPPACDTEKPVLLWDLSDSCQSLPPHGARDLAEAPSSCCCQAGSPPGSLLANPVWQGANWDLSDSTQCLESHFVLPPGRGKRRRREPAEGVCTFSLPSPLLQFYRLITSITEKGVGGGESGDFNYFI